MSFSATALSATHRETPEMIRGKRVVRLKCTAVSALYANRRFARANKNAARHEANRQCSHRARKPKLSLRQSGSVT